MILMLYAAAVIVLSFFMNWWFLLALIVPAFKLPVLLKRARILGMLSSEYQYEFPATAPQAHTLNRMERETRSKKPTDEELATLFMAVMVNSLISDEEEVKTFARRVWDNASRLATQGAISQAVYAEIQEVVQQKTG